MSKALAVAQYWLDPGYADNAYYTETQAAIVRVAAPQSVILLGAALGGLIAYFIFPRRPLPSVGATTRVGHMFRYFQRISPFSF